jgi:8-oxo-dGTP pyrophosphatase MutT (NUDIX family)
VELSGRTVRDDETPEVAAERELREEIGLQVSTLQPTGVVCGDCDRVHVFELRLNALPNLRLDHREIIGAILVEPIELSSIKLTGPVLAYLEAMGQPTSAA